MDMKDIIEKQRKESASRAVKKFGPELWHYTNFNAFDGIVNNKEIWFGSAACMNDKSESKDFINRLENVILEEVTQGNRKKVTEIFDMIRARLSGRYPFIFCVSCACDDAAQWERYANRGEGVAIVFSTEWLNKLLTNNAFIMDEEYYEYDVEKHEMKQILVDYIEKGKLNGFPDLEGIVDNLLLCATIHKHRSFASEKEVRMAPLLVDENDKCVQYKIMGIIKKVYIVDLESLCEKENIKFTDLIEAIVIGPRSQQNIADFQWYLKKIRLPELVEKVKQSDCPLR